MRVKTGSVRRKSHKKILKANKGFQLTNSKTFKRAKEAYLHAGQYAYNDRRKKKSQIRQLWITRINAGLKSMGLKYKDYIHNAKKANVDLDRKVLAELAVNEPETFKAVTEVVMK